MLMDIGVNYLREHMDDRRPHPLRVHRRGRSLGERRAADRRALLHRAIPHRWPACASCTSVSKKVAQWRGADDRRPTVEIEFDGACAELLPNRTLEERLHANVKELGGVPFDEADQEYGRRITAGFPEGSLEFARSMRSLPDDASPYFDGILPLVDPAHRFQMTGSTDVGDVSWVTPTVQIVAGTAAPGHPGALLADGRAGKEPGRPQGHDPRRHGDGCRPHSISSPMPRCSARRGPSSTPSSRRRPMTAPSPRAPSPPPLRPTYRPA